MLLAFLLFPLPVAVAQAPDSGFQHNWRPNDYRVVCPEDKSCALNEEEREYVASMMKIAVHDFSKTPFRAPTWWAPRRTEASGDDGYMVIHDSGHAEQIAHTSGKCSSNTLHHATMNVGGKIGYLREKDADYFNYSHLVHELFHMNQYEYPFYDRNRCNQHGGVPGWLMESTAQAVAMDMMIKRFPDRWPAKRNKMEAREMAGLRRYDKPLPIVVYDANGQEKKSGSPVYYQTHSFWRHVAETHHGGTYDFLGRYLEMPLPAGGSWDSWLRSNMQNVTGEDLGLVFGAFLADFAGWGDRGHPGGLYRRQPWLKEAFDGCESIYLNKAQPADYVELTLAPLSGKCINVAVATMGPDGLKPGESFSVQIAGIVTSAPKTARGGIHLGMAASNDSRGFLCADEIREAHKKAVGKCLFTPDDGKIRFEGGEIDARVWEVVAQKPGTAGRDGELINLYTVSYTPTQIVLRDSTGSSGKSVSVKIYFVLDRAKTKVDGREKKDAVGTFGTSNADPQTTLPKRDASGRPVNSYSKPDQHQPPAAIPPTTGTRQQGKLAHLAVSAGGTDEAIPTSVQVHPARPGANGELEKHALSVGETGTFPALLYGDLGQEPAVSLEGASLVVEEFTDLVFRARFQGTMCRHRDVVPGRPGVSVEEPCRNPFPVSGEITKAFAGSRLPGRHMVVERTDGTELYRQANEKGWQQWLMEDRLPGGPGAGAAEPGIPGIGGGRLDACDCSCEEYALIEEDSLATKSQGDHETLQALAAKGMQCAGQCQREYMLCNLVASKDTASETTPEEEAQPNCDCSCDGLQNLQIRMSELTAQFQAGGMDSMKEMQQLGECVSVCQSELMNCSAGH